MYIVCWSNKGPFKCYIRQMGGGAGGRCGVNFSGEKRYEDLMFNVISVTRGRGGPNSWKKALCKT